MGGGGILLAVGDAVHDGGFRNLVSGKFADFLRSRRTITRLAAARDFFQLGRNKDNGHALLAEVFHFTGNFEFGADIDAAGGLVEDEQFRAGGEPAGEDDFLLVAAGEVFDGGFGVGGFDVKSLDETVGDLPLLASGNGTEPPALGLQDQKNILADRRSGTMPAILRSSGQKPRPRRMAARGERIRTGWPSMAMRPESAASDAEEKPDEFGATGAQKAGEADDFALLDVEIDWVGPSRGDRLPERAGKRQFLPAAEARCPALMAFTCSTSRPIMRAMSSIRGRAAVW